MKNKLYPIALGLLSFSNLLSVEEHSVLGKNGENLFNVAFFNKGEKFKDADSNLLKSTYSLEKTEKKIILDTAKYWREVLKTDNSSPSKIFVYTSNDENASAYSGIVENEGDAKGMTQLQANLLGKNFDHSSKEPISIIEVGKMNFKTGSPSNLPNLDGSDLFSTIVHEIGHAIGITGTAHYDSDTNLASFEDVLSKFDQGLMDSNGKKISETTGNIYFVNENGDEVGNKDTDFDASTGVYFVGKNVSEVLGNSSLAGVPINIGLEDASDDEDVTNLIPELSHLEMDRGIMSHQSYRNYTTFMEAELAVLQDMGYDIDRRNFYGLSVYEDSLTLDNYNGYFLRDEKGENYIVGKPNTTPYGVGLHVYGNNNTIVQKGDLLASGLAGTGIRIDGIENDITVDKNTKVYADGDYGTAVLIAYGKGHTVTNDGDIRARGEKGVAVRFDFGTGLLDSTYLGSYILFSEGVDFGNSLSTIDDDSLKADEIDGALVENFNTSGYIEGKDASLFMSKNAYVKNINVLNGAVLKGDIISMYSPKMLYDNNIVITETNLNLGVSKDNLSKGDNNFSFKFNDNIIGKNIALNIKGGKSSLNGNNEILRATIDEGATLSGNSSYIIGQNEFFVNNGTISPGNSIGKITIKGDYKQENNGKVDLEFDGNGNHDTLEIVGNAYFSDNSSMKLIPQKSYYSKSFPINQNEYLKVDGIRNGKINNFILDDSIFNSSSTIKKASFDSNSSSMVVSRNENAYSKFSDNKSTKGFAKAIDKISDQASGPMKDFIGTLDFASPQTISSALSQTAPNIYGSNIVATFEAEKEHSSSVRNHLMEENNYEFGESYAFANMFYKDSWQKGSSYLTGYDYRDQGVLTGIEKKYSDKLTLGTHILYSDSTLKDHGDNNAKIKSKSIYLGLHGKYYPKSNEEGYLYGAVRGGLQENKLTNNISFDDYKNNTNSDWNSINGSSLVGYARDIKQNQFILTPFVELGYSVLRPEESKDDNLGINIDSKTYHSAYYKVGGKVSTKKMAIGENVKISGNILAAYNYDFIDEYNIDGNIAKNSDSSFRVKTKNPGKDSMNLQGGTTVTIKEDLDVTLGVGTDLFGSVQKFV